MTRTVTIREASRCRRLRLIWPALALVCLASPAIAQISDDFSAAELDTTLWQLVDPRGDGELVIAGGQATLTVPAGRPHDAGSGDNNTLRLLQNLPDADFSLAARFDSVPQELGQEQGLIVLQNPGTHVRLAANHDGKQLVVIWARTVNNQVLDQGRLTIAATDTISLRLERTGDYWTADYRTGGGSWLAAFAFNHTLRVDRGGVYAANFRLDATDNPYDRDNPPVDKSTGGDPVPAMNAVVDYFFDTNNPIVPEDPAARTFTGLEAFYYFRAGSPHVVFDYAGTATPYHLTQLDSTAVTWLPEHGLSLDQPTLVTAPRPATELNQAIMTTGALTLEAWLDPSTTDQSGPARILTVSGDPSNRNATLSHGQWGLLPSDVFDVRLRTTEQSLNGQPDLVSPAGSLTGDLQHVVYTRDALGVTRIFVDGVETVSSLAGGDLSNWDATYPLALGGELDGTRNWLGTLYLAAVYSRALAPAEVAANFAAGPDGGALPPLAPAVILQGIAPGDMFDFTDTITLDAVANDADGVIAAVEFRIGTRVLARDETAPYHFEWTNPTTGGQQIRAVAIDNDGLETDSDVVPIHVGVPVSYEQALYLSDTFFDANLDAPWTLVDTSGGAAISQSGGSVYVSLPTATQSPWDPAPAVVRAYQAELDTDLALDLMIDRDNWSADGFTGLELADSLGATVRFVAESSGGNWSLSWGSAAAGDPVLAGTVALGSATGPLWLQLRRQGSTCELLYTDNGLTWQPLATVNQSLTLNRAGWLAGATTGTATIALDHAFNLASPIAPEDGELGDRDGPVISQLNTTTTFDELTFDWLTDEPAYYRLRYGLTTAFELGLIDGGFFSTTHNAVVPGLTPGQTYYLQLTCLDTAGNVTVADLPAYTDAMATAAAGPTAGDVYRETALGFGSGNDDWRVTDPDALNPGAAEFLPNPVLSLTVPDLTSAVRAELVIDRWGGHPGTTGKKIRLNGGSWLHVPDPATIPDDQPECYVYQDNPMIELPLDQLVAGLITLEGSADEQSCYSFDWGQWGWYGVVLRVYYDGSVPRPDGSFLAPAPGDTITDSVGISVAATGAVDLVHVLARYDGVDGDGDGVTGGWHRYYRRARYNNTLNLDGIVGTVTAAPWDLTWDAAWVPDQVPGSVALQARLRDDTGVWYVTEVDSLSLNHSNGVIKAYPLLDVPRSFWVRTGNSIDATFNIPTADSLSQAAEVQLTATTWNGADKGVIAINNVTVAGNFGLYYFFSLDTFPASPVILQPGANTLTISADTIEHGMEVLWPGPLVKVRYGPPNSGAALAVMPGDLDRNGELDSRDTQLVLEQVVGAISLSAAQINAADVDRNGRVDAVDAGLIVGLSPKAAAEANPPRISAQRDPDDAGRVSISLAGLSGRHALELVVAGADLESRLKDIEIPGADKDPLAWRVQGDTLRVAMVGRNPELSLSLANGTLDLAISAKVDSRRLADVKLLAPDIPARFELVGNYPNPFNPTTTIAFNLPRPATVRLRVHDVRGRVVATVVNESLPAGRHKVLWNGRDQQGRTVASGTFFYRLEAGGRVWTRKMLLLK